MYAYFILNLDTIVMLLDGWQIMRASLITPLVYNNQICIYIKGDPISCFNSIHISLTYNLRTEKWNA